MSDKKIDADLKIPKELPTAGRPVKNIIDPIPACAEDIAKAIFEMK